MIPSEDRGVKTHSLRRRILSAFTLLAFLITNHSVPPAGANVFSNVGADPRVRPLRDDANGSTHGSTPTIDTLRVPENIGTLQEHFQGKDSATVVLIQDAHSLPEAQQSIERLIGHFYQEYRIPLVAVEGASSRLDPQIFHSFPDQELLKETLKEYSGKGELSGVVSAAILGSDPNTPGVRPHHMQFLGIDDWKMYEEGLILYLRALEKEPEILERLEKEKAECRKRKAEVYSKVGARRASPLREIDEAIERFYENEMNLAEAVKKLKRVGAGLKPAPTFEVKPGPALAALMDQIEHETPVSLEIEVKRVARSVGRALRANVGADPRVRPLQGAGKRVGPTHGSAPTLDGAVAREFHARLQQYRTSQISAETFALYLKELIERHHLPIPTSRLLRKSAHQEQKLRDIQGTELFEEFEEYAEGVMEALLGSDPNTSGVRPQEEAKALHLRTQHLRLLTRLAKLELTRKDWEEIKKWNVGADPRVRPMLGNANGSTHGSTPTIDVDFSNHFEFYRNAECREEAMFENLMKYVGADTRVRPTLGNANGPTHGSAPTARTTNSTILIAGGFHTRGLTERLKQAGISYVLVMPKIGHIPDQTNYRDHMKGNVSWKGYFRVEKGRINLYEAFVRAARDKLLGMNVGADPRVRPLQGAGKRVGPTHGSAPTLKRWRDQIILDLAAQNRIEDAHQYTRFLDEISSHARSATKHGGQSALRKQWLANIDRFAAGLRKLQAADRLTDENVLKLLNHATTVAGAAAPGLLGNHSILAEAVGRGPRQGASSEMRGQLVWDQVKPKLEAFVEAQEILAKEGLRIRALLRLKRPFESDVLVRGQVDSVFKVDVPAYSDGLRVQFSSIDETDPSYMRGIFRTHESTLTLVSWPQPSYRVATEEKDKKVEGVLKPEAIGLSGAFHHPIGPEQFIRVSFETESLDAFYEPDLAEKARTMRKLLSGYLTEHWTGIRETWDGKGDLSQEVEDRERNYLLRWRRESATELSLKIEKLKTSQSVWPPKSSRWKLGRWAAPFVEDVSVPEGPQKESTPLITAKLLRSPPETRAPRLSDQEFDGLLDSSRSEARSASAKPSTARSAMSELRGAPLTLTVGRTEGQQIQIRSRDGQWPQPLLAKKLAQLAPVLLEQTVQVDLPTDEETLPTIPPEVGRTAEGLAQQIQEAIHQRALHPVQKWFFESSPETRVTLVPTAFDTENMEGVSLKQEADADQVLVRIQRALEEADGILRDLFRQDTKLRDLQKRYRRLGEGVWENVFEGYFQSSEALEEVLGSYLEQAPFLGESGSKPREILQFEIANLMLTFRAFQEAIHKKYPGPQGLSFWVRLARLGVKDDSASAREEFRKRMLAVLLEHGATLFELLSGDEEDRDLYWLTCRNIKGPKGPSARLPYMTDSQGEGRIILFTPDLNYSIGPGIGMDAEDQKAILRQLLPPASYRSEARGIETGTNEIDTKVAERFQPLRRSILILPERELENTVLTLRNVKEAGPDVTFLFDSNPDSLMMEVHVDGEETGSIALERYHKSGIKILANTPFDILRERDSAKFEGRGVENTILNWLRWEAVQNGWQIENSGTASIPLIHLYHKYFADRLVLRGRRLKDFRKSPDLKAAFEDYGNFGSKIFGRLNISIRSGEAVLLGGRVRLKKMNGFQNRYRVTWAQRDAELDSGQLIEVSRKGEIEILSGGVPYRTSLFIRLGEHGLRVAGRPQADPAFPVPQGFTRSRAEAWASARLVDLSSRHYQWLHRFESRSEVRTEPLIAKMVVPDFGKIPRKFKKKTLVIAGALGEISERYAGPLAQWKEGYNTTLVGVDLSSLEKAQATLEQKNLPFAPQHYYSKDDFWRALKEGSLSPDGILVLTRPDTHLEYIRAALKRGIPVFVEKPMVLPGQLGKLMKLNQRYPGLIFAIDHFFDLQVLLEALRYATPRYLGDLIAVEGKLSQREILPKHRNWVADPSVSGGGAVLDAMIHLIAADELFLGQFGESIEAWQTAPDEIHFGRYRRAPGKRETYARVGGRIPGKSGPIKINFEVGKGLGKDVCYLHLKGTQGNLHINYKIKEGRASLRYRDARGKGWIRSFANEESGHPNIVLKIYDQMHGLRQVPPREIRRRFNASVRAIRSITNIYKTFDESGGRYVRYKVGTHPLRSEARGEQTTVQPFKIYLDVSDALALSPLGTEKFAPHEIELRKELSNEISGRFGRYFFDLTSRLGYWIFSKTRRLKWLPIVFSYEAWLLPFTQRLHQRHFEVLVKDWRLNPHFTEAVDLIRRESGLDADREVKIVIVSGNPVQINKAFLKREDIARILSEKKISIEIQGVRLRMNSKGFFTGIIQAAGDLFYAGAQSFPEDAVVLGDDIMVKYGFGSRSSLAGFINIQTFNPRESAQVIRRKLAQLDSPRSEARASHPLMKWIETKGFRPRHAQALKKRILNNKDFVKKMTFLKQILSFKKMILKLGQMDREGARAQVDLHIPWQKQGVLTPEDVLEKGQDLRIRFNIKNFRPRRRNLNSWVSSFTHEISEAYFTVQALNRPGGVPSSVIGALAAGANSDAPLTLKGYFHWKGIEAQILSSHFTRLTRKEQEAIAYQWMDTGSTLFLMLRYPDVQTVGEADHPVKTKAIRDLEKIQRVFTHAAHRTALDHRSPFLAWALEYRRQAALPSGDRGIQKAEVREVLSRLPVERNETGPGTRDQQVRPKPAGEGRKSGATGTPLLGRAEARSTEENDERGELSEQPPVVRPDYFVEYGGERDVLDFRGFDMPPEWMRYFARDNVDNNWAVFLHLMSADWNPKVFLGSPEQLSSQDFKKVREKVDQKNEEDLIQEFKHAKEWYGAISDRIGYDSYYTFIADFFALTQVLLAIKRNSRDKLRIGVYIGPEQSLTQPFYEDPVIVFEENELLYHVPQLSKLRIKAGSEGKQYWVLEEKPDGGTEVLGGPLTETISEYTTSSSKTLRLGMVRSEDQEAGELRLRIENPGTDPVFFICHPVSASRSEVRTRKTAAAKQAKGISYEEVTIQGEEDVFAAKETEIRKKLTDQGLGNHFLLIHKKIQDEKNQDIVKHELYEMARDKGRETVRAVVWRDGSANIGGALSDLIAQFGRNFLERISDSKQIPIISSDQPLLLAEAKLGKAWGDEIPYTMIESRFVAEVTDGKGIKKSKLPDVLRLFPERFGVDPKKNLVLLKMLSPGSKEVESDLYMEVHWEKYELYVVTEIDRKAWPNGVGEIVCGLNPELVTRYKKNQDANWEAAYKRDFRAASDKYRREIYKKFAAKDKKILGEDVDEERRLRDAVYKFTGKRKVKVGDVVVFPKGVVHSLRHGIKVAEVLTFHYERGIIVPTLLKVTSNEGNWNTDDAFDVMNMSPYEPPAIAFVASVSGQYEIQRLATFPIGTQEFTTDRVFLKASSRLQDSTVFQDANESYHLLMALDGSLKVTLKNGSEQVLKSKKALIIPVKAGNYSVKSLGGKPAVYLKMATLPKRKGAKVPGTDLGTGKKPRSEARRVVEHKPGESGLKPLPKRETSSEGSGFEYKGWNNVLLVQALRAELRAQMENGKPERPDKRILFFRRLEGDASKFLGWRTAAWGVVLAGVILASVLFFQPPPLFRSPIPPPVSLQEKQRILDKLQPIAEALKNPGEKSLADLFLQEISKSPLTILESSESLAKVIFDLDGKVDGIFMYRDALQMPRVFIQRIMVHEGFHIKEKTSLLQRILPARWRCREMVKTARDTKTEASFFEDPSFLKTLLSVIIPLWDDETKASLAGDIIVIRDLLESASAKEIFKKLELDTPMMTNQNLLNLIGAEFKELSDKIDFQQRTNNPQVTAEHALINFVKGVQDNDEHPFRLELKALLIIVSEKTKGIVELNKSRKGNFEWNILDYPALKSWLDSRAATFEIPRFDPPSRSKGQIHPVLRAEAREKMMGGGLDRRAKDYPDISQALKDVAEAVSIQVRKQFRSELRKPPSRSEARRPEQLEGRATVLRRAPQGEASLPTPLESNATGTPPLGRAEARSNPADLSTASASQGSAMSEARGIEPVRIERKQGQVTIFWRTSYKGFPYEEAVRWIRKFQPMPAAVIRRKKSLPAHEEDIVIPYSDPRTGFVLITQTEWKDFLRQHRPSFIVGETEYQFTGDTLTARKGDLVETIRVPAFLSLANMKMLGQLNTAGMNMEILTDPHQKDTALQALHSAFQEYFIFHRDFLTVAPPPVTLPRQSLKAELERIQITKKRYHNASYLGWLKFAMAWIQKEEQGDQSIITELPSDQTFLNYVSELKLDSPGGTDDGIITATFSEMRKNPHASKSFAVTSVADATALALAPEGFEGFAAGIRRAELRKIPEVVERVTLDRFVDQVREQMFAMTQNEVQQFEAARRVAKAFSEIPEGASVEFQISGKQMNEMGANIRSEMRELVATVSGLLQNTPVGEIAVHFPEGTDLSPVLKNIRRGAPFKTEVRKSEVRFLNPQYLEHPVQNPMKLKMTPDLPSSKGQIFDTSRFADRSEMRFNKPGRASAILLAAVLSLTTLTGGLLIKEYSAPNTIVTRVTNEPALDGAVELGFKLLTERMLKRSA